MTDHRPIATWLTDMDGVLVHEEDPIPGATEFIEALKQVSFPDLAPALEMPANAGGQILGMRLLDV